MPHSLPLNLGVAEDGRLLTVDVVAESAHVAIQGQTRSGKSTFMYNQLPALAALPWVRTAGIDPTSLLLAPFAERGEDLIALGGGEWSQALRVLHAIQAETAARIAAMPAARIDKIADFTPDVPLLVLVLEEYPGILEGAEDEDADLGRKPGDRIEPKIRRAVRQLVAQSAKAGVRVILLAQRAEAGILGGASRSNFGTRLTFRVDNPDSVRMLHPSADAELCERAENFAPGVAIVDRPGARREIVRGPAVTYADYYDHVLKACPQGEHRV